MPKPIVERFWVRPDNTDAAADEGWVQWSDGIQEHAINVMKDPSVITDPQWLYLVRELTLHMPGLSSVSQISYVYDGALFAALMTDSGVDEEEADAPVAD